MRPSLNLLLAILLPFAASCSKEDESKTNKLSKLIETRFEARNNLDTFNEETIELMKFQGDLRREISDLRSKRKSEKSKLISDFKDTVDETFQAKFADLTKSKAKEMDSAMNSFRADPRLRPIISRRDKRDEIKALNREYTVPVKTKFDAIEKDARDLAKKEVLEYTEKVKQEVDAKYPEIETLEAKLELMENEIEKRDSEQDERYTKIKALTKKIEHLKELKNAEK